MCITQELQSLSPYDDSFPMRLLQDAFKIRSDEAQDITERIYRDMTSKAAQPILLPNKGEEKLRLTVDLSDEQLQNYKDGVMKLSKEKGHMVAQIRKDGRYGAKLPIKEEKYTDVANTLDVQNAIQLQAIQEALASITVQIQAIDENVKEILTGQQNDRLGLYYSGVALFMEADSLSNEELKNQLMSQSLKTLTDAIFQLTLTLQSDIRYLQRREYDKEKREKYNLMSEKVSTIDRAFMAIHQATVMKMAIYCMRGELKAMMAVLAQYEKFIKETIADNSEMLSQCTAGDSGKLSGLWKSRANLRLDTEKVARFLNKSDTPIYIEYAGENCYESI